jgi:hypothetical protein
MVPHLETHLHRLMALELCDLTGRIRNSLTLRVARDDRSDHQHQCVDYRCLLCQ